jgi:superfamily II DNA or RNA helicase
MLATETPPASITLRPYQQQALTAIEAAALRGVQRQVVSLPTGAGKTIIFTHLLVHRHTRTLIVVHREELITQTLEKLSMMAQGTALDIGVVKADRDEHAGDVVVASVQTLARAARLQRLAQSFGLVIVDEAHHALPDNSYGRILQHVGALHPDGPLTVGYTATPFRPNNDPIITTPDAPGCFDEIVYALPLMSLIAQGYLCSIQAKGLFLDGLNLDHVRVRHGDYVAQDLAEALMAARTPEHLVRGYDELAPGRRALVFCPTVAMAEAVEQTFTDAGFAAALVVGQTPTTERQAIYAQVRAGQLHALVTCAVLTEGFDEPSIDCVMLARPTKSKVLFFQCLGRGLRLWPTKADCLMIDATGVTRRHGLLSMAAELGLLTPKPVQEGVVGGEHEEQDEEDEEPAAQPSGYRAHDINLAARTRLHWVETPRGYWVVSLADRMLRVRANGQGAYLLEVRQRDERRYTRLVDHLSQEFCFGIASDTARDAHLLHLVREGARWREKPPSPKQTALAQKLGVQVHPAWGSGEVSDAIARITGQWYD